MNEYDDIINLERPISIHPKMSIEMRAAQFAPFAALTGYEEQVKETARVTSKEIKMSSDEMEILNEKLNIIMDNLCNKPKVKFTYFEKDKTKNGGSYKSVSGEVKKIDFSYRVITLFSGYKIFIDSIIDISCDLFKEIKF